MEIASPGEARRKKFQWLSKAGSLDGEGVVLVPASRRTETFPSGVKEGICTDSAAGEQGRKIVGWKFKVVVADGVCVWSHKLKQRLNTHSDRLISVQIGTPVH